MLLSDVCLSIVYIGPKPRTERPRKTKIGTEVAHITRDSDTTFKVKGQGHQAALLTATLKCQTAPAVSVGTYWAWETTSTLRCARRREALRRPQGEERGVGISWRPPAYSFFSSKKFSWTKTDNLEEYSTETDAALWMQVQRIGRCLESVGRSTRARNVASVSRTRRCWRFTDERTPENDRTLVLCVIRGSLSRDTSLDTTEYTQVSLQLLLILLLLLLILLLLLLLLAGTPR